MKRTRIVDHRGKAMWICRLEDLPEGASRELRKSVLAADVLHWRNYVLAFSAMGGVALGAAIRRGPGKVDFLAVALGLPILLVSILVVSLLLARRRARGAGKACLEAGLCAACGYQVAGSDAADADGCVVCPECGAAWLSEGLPGDGSLPR